MKTHPYNVGDRVWLHLDDRSERATVRSIGWASHNYHQRPQVHLLLDHDRDTGQKGVYKFDCSPRITPISAVDQLAEITS